MAMKAKTIAPAYVVGALSIGILVASCGRAEDKGLGATKQSLGSGLPVRDFVQLPRMCQGATNDLDSFMQPDGTSLGTVFGQFSTTGQYSLWIREPNGSQYQIAPAAWYVDSPVAGSTDKFRIVCATAATLVDQGPGPVGEVYSYDKTNGTSILCWVNPRGTTTWRETVAAVPDSSGPSDALWLLAIGGTQLPDAGTDDPNSFELVYLRDAEYARWIRTSIGRQSREGAYFVRMTIASNGSGSVSLFDRDSYPDWRDEARAQMGTLDCTGYCGWRRDAVDWTNCGACASGQTCSNGECVTGSCTRLTVAQACVPDSSGNAPCGQRSDGCGGLLTCPSCPTGTTCGATLDVSYCGKRPTPLTISLLRAVYADDNDLLCGTFVDTVTGVNVTMDSICNNCQINLCRDKPLPPCTPSGGLGNPDPGDGGDGG
jgi:hypothetical protein